MKVHEPVDDSEVGQVTSSSRKQAALERSSKGGIFTHSIAQSNQPDALKPVVHVLYPRLVFFK